MQNINAVKNRINTLLSSSPLFGRFAKGAIWTMIGTIIAQGLNLLASFVTARFLGKVGFGELMILINTVSMLGTFAGLGLGVTATKYIAENKKNNPERAGRIIGLTLQVLTISAGLLAAGLFIFAPQLASKSLNAPQLEPYLKICIILLFFNAFSSIQTSILAGMEEFRAIAKVNMWTGIIRFPVIIAGIMFAGFDGAIYANILMGIIMAILFQIALRREYKNNNLKPSFKDTISELPVLWKFSIPAFLNSILYAPVIWIANTILVRQPGGYGEMGIFGAANQWQTILLFIPSIFEQVAVPIMCSSKEEDNREETLKKTLIATQSLTVALIFPAAVLLIFVADYIMKFYGETFVNTSPVLILVLCTIMIIAAGKAINPIIIAKNKMWFGFFINALWGLLLITFAHLLTPHYGAKGLALSFAIAYLIITLATFAYLFKLLPEGFIRRAVFSLIFAVGITAAGIFTPINLRLILLLPAVILTTISSLYLFTCSDFRCSLFNLIQTAARQLNPMEATKKG